MHNYVNIIIFLQNIFIYSACHQPTHWPSNELINPAGQGFACPVPAVAEDDLACWGGWAEAVWWGRDGWGNWGRGWLSHGCGCHGLKAIHVCGGRVKVSAGCLKCHWTVCQITAIDAVVFVRDTFRGMCCWVLYPGSLWVGRKFRFCDDFFTEIWSRFWGCCQFFFHELYVVFELEA